MNCLDHLKTTKGHFQKTLVICVTVMACISVFASTVYADIGPKPQIELTIQNAPSEDYFVALISRERGVPSDFEPDQQYSEEENEILRTFYAYNEDGYTLFQNGSHSYYFRSQNDSRFHISGYAGVLPDSYKILLITLDGKVCVSNEITQKFLHAECVFDCETGDLKEKQLTFSSFGSWLSQVFFCLMNAYNPQTCVAVLGIIKQQIKRYHFLTPNVK